MKEQTQFQQFISSVKNVFISSRRAEMRNLLRFLVKEGGLMTEAKSPKFPWIEEDEFFREYL